MYFSFFSRRKNSFLILVIFLFATFPVFAQSSQAQFAKLGEIEINKASEKTEVEKWQEDLQFLASEMPKRHKNLFHTISKKEFETAISKLKERLPMLTRNQAIMEFGKIVAMIGDGHTTLWTVFDREATFADYANNIDTAMKAVLEYKPQKSLDELLSETEQTKDFKSLKTTLIAYKNDPANKYLNIEGRINRFGYMKIFYRKVDLAIKFFKLNTELFPKSANTFDSLAEACLLNGNKDFAIKYYKKSLELNPNNTNAADQIKKLSKYTDFDKSN